MNPNRKTAPNVSVQDVFKDDRQDILDKLDEASPDSVHMYQRQGVDEFTLMRMYQEVVKNEQGIVIHHNGDPVVRVPRKHYEAKLRLEHEQSKAAIGAMAKDPAKFNRVAKPVVVKDTTGE